MSKENNANENGGNQHPVQIGEVNFNIDVQGIAEQFLPQFEMPELPLIAPIDFQPEIKLDIEKLNAQTGGISEALASHGTFKQSSYVEQIMKDFPIDVNPNQKFEINKDHMKTGYDHKNPGDPDANDGLGNGFQFNMK